MIQQETNRPKPYTYDWWFSLGYKDRNKLPEPKHPGVKPYLEGWNEKEDDDRDTWGNVDFINE